MGGIKRLLGDRPPPEGIKPSVSDLINWSSEASTEAVFVKASSFGEILRYEFFKVKIRGQHNGILGFFEIELQRYGMTAEEQHQAVETVKDLRAGEKIIYWTRGVNVYSPKDWFYKIERR